MLRHAYDSVMNEERNAFSRLPKTTRFQLMTVLAVFWSAVFTISFSAYHYFGATVVAHVAVLLAVFFTADVFRRTREGRFHHRDAMRRASDGTARYDDLWGA